MTNKLSGNIEFQIESLNKKISLLTEHLKKNHKDYSSHRGLMKLVSHKKSLIKYLNGKKK